MLLSASAVTEPSLVAPGRTMRRSGTWCPTSKISGGDLDMDATAIRRHGHASLSEVVAMPPGQLFTF